MPQAPVSRASQIALFLPPWNTRNQTNQISSCEILRYRPSYLFSEHTAMAFLPYNKSLGIDDGTRKGCPVP